MKLDRKERFRITEQAALQLIRSSESASEETRSDFLDWSRLSAHHVHELLFVQAAARALEGVDPEKSLDVDALPTLPELAASDEERELFAQAASISAAARLGGNSLSARRRLRRWATGLAAVCAAIVVAWLFSRSSFNDWRATYATAVGEQRSIKLDDGSIMVLNTASCAKVQFSTTTREIRLLDGEALFVVQRDTHRPFRVSTAAGSIVALGTQFNVYEQNGATRVAVVDGTVQVSSGTAVTQLAAGDEAVIHPGRVMRERKPDVHQAIAWQARQLVFRDSSLGYVAAEFNRYNKRRIRIEDAKLRTLSISGVFDADDAEPLIDFLQSDPRLIVERSANEIAVRPRPAS